MLARLLARDLPCFDKPFLGACDEVRRLPLRVRVACAIGAGISAGFGGRECVGGMAGRGERGAAGFAVQLAAGCTHLASDVYHCGGALGVGEGQSSDNVTWTIKEPRPMRGRECRLGVEASSGAEAHVERRRPTLEIGQLDTAGR